MQNDAGAKGTNPPRDHFSAVAKGYFAFRPRYPAEMFDFLAQTAPGHALAWDCGCGSGQATTDLASRFDRVLGTDLAAAQIQAAPQVENIAWRAADAPDSGLPDASVNLITAAQALHWFDLDAFYAEVRRVLAPGGVIAAWSYGIVQVADDVIDAPVQHFRTVTVGPFWPAERRHVENGYRDLPFPFEEIAAPAFAMEAEWDLPQLLGYIRSWSSVGRYIAEHGADPVSPLADELLALWGDPATRRTVRWPLTLRIGRVPV
ncbi:MAG: class I SAM-dependent methyltransferase [Rhodocyclaceae bacterium]